MLAIKPKDVGTLSPCSLTFLPITEKLLHLFSLGTSIKDLLVWACPVSLSIKARINWFFCWKVQLLLDCIAKYHVFFVFLPVHTRNSRRHSVCQHYFFFLRECVLILACKLHCCAVIKKWSDGIGNFPLKSFNLQQDFGTCCGLLWILLLMKWKVSIRCGVIRVLQQETYCKDTEHLAGSFCPWLALHKVGEVFGYWLGEESPSVIGMLLWFV